MPRLFITGDTHGSLELKKLSNKNFPLARELTKDDIVIICGDAGFLWNNTKETQYWDDWAEDRPFTIISCFGNHSNYTALRSIPITTWNGAQVRKVRPHVMYIENGEIAAINQKTFFFMGGAHSVDKAYRTLGISYWEEEIPSYQEFQYAAANLQQYDDKVDYIISHTGPNSLVHHLFPYEDATDSVTNFLEKYVNNCVEFKRWFLGHFHIDCSYANQKYNILYDDIIELLPNNEMRLAI